MDSDKKSPSLKGSIQEEEQPAPVPPGEDSPKLSVELDRQSDKSGKSSKTQKSDDSKKKKAKSPEEPFVVGE